VDDYGTLEPAGSSWRLEFSRLLPHPPDKVWRALTEPEHLAAWFPTEINGPRTEGAALDFVFRHGEGPSMKGTMVTYDPPRLLEFRWGDETLRFELRAEEGSTELRFVNTFDELGKAARDAAGWHVCLELLALSLAGERPKESGDRWSQVHPVYVKRFGLAAATIGRPDSNTG
jgi:uncharacterized protein YndB with AHSA1/START domain